MAHALIRSSHTGAIRARLALFLLALVAAICHCTMFAWGTDIYWAVDVGDWDDLRNWGGGRVPGSNGDSAHVENGGTAMVTDDTPATTWTSISGNNGVTSTVDVVAGGVMHVNESLSVGLYASTLGAAGVLNQSGGSVQVAILSVGEQAGAIGLYHMTGGDLWVRYSTYVGGLGVGQFDMIAGSMSSNDHFFVGGTGGSGFFNQTGGSVGFAGNASIGDSGAGTMVVNDSDGPASFTANGDMVVGNHGIGSGTVFHSAAASATVSVHSLTLGQDSSASGTYNLSGNAALTLTGGGLTVGNNGSGTFNMSGNSTLTANTSAFVNVGNSGTGTFTMSGGTVNNSGGLMVGWYGGSIGTVDQSGGVMNAAWTSVGYQGAGTYHLSGGTLNAGGSLAVGQQGAGAFVQDGGTINVNVFTEVGETGTGNYTMNGGTLNPGPGDSASTRASLTINYNSASNSTFTQNGGTVNLGNGSWLQIAQNPGTKGTYNMNGGLLNGGASDISVSGGGMGTFNQTGGTVIAGALSLATWNSASSTYNLSGGALTLTGNVNDGVGGTGTLNLDGGTLSVGGGTITVDYLNVGNVAGSNGFHTMTAGQTTIVNSGFTVGNSGTGVFTQNGGTVTAPSLAMGVNLLSSGAYNLNGGNLSLSGNVVAGLGTSTLNIDGGALAVGGGQITVDHFHIGNAPGANGAHTLIAGKTITARSSFEVGVTGAGTFTQNGGVVTTPSLLLGASVGSDGAYLLHGGLLDVGGGTISGGAGLASFGFTGGTLKVATFNGANLGGGLTQDDASGPSLLDASSNDTSIDGFYQLNHGAAMAGAGYSINMTGPMTTGIGTVDGNGTINATHGFSIGTQLTKYGTGILNVDGPQLHAPGSVLEVNDGTLNMMSDAGAGGANLTIAVDPSTVHLTASQHLAGLSIGVGSTVTLAASADPPYPPYPSADKLLWTNSLSVAGAGAKLDLASNKLIVQAAPGGGAAVLAAVTTDLASGYHDGVWDGDGINSSVAAADANHLTALGVMLNVDALSNPIYTSFAGDAVDRSSVLVAYTYNGDANLSGVVDGTDFALIDNGFNYSLSGWFNGDFNYDGHVDGTDYAFIDNAFNFQGGPLTTGNGLDPVSVTSLQAVPEPGSILLFAIGANAMLFHIARRLRSR